MPLKTTTRLYLPLDVGIHNSLERCAVVPHALLFDVDRVDERWDRDQAVGDGPQERRFANAIPSNHSVSHTIVAHQDRRVEKELPRVPLRRPAIPPRRTDISYRCVEGWRGGGRGRRAGVLQLDTVSCVEHDVLDAEIHVHVLPLGCTGTSPLKEPAI
jgi:hypothetical protein